MAKILLLTGPVQTGKTTRLSHWCATRTDVGGLLSPVLQGKRWFQDLRTREKKLMESEPEETEIQQVGRYTFSTATFNWANEKLLQNSQDQDINWLVIDEIGPLELQEKGLHPALEILFKNLPAHQKLILVIREKILERVLEKYDLERHGVAYFDFLEV